MVHLWNLKLANLWKNSLEKMDWNFTRYILKEIQNLHGDVHYEMKSCTNKYYIYSIWNTTDVFKAILLLHLLMFVILETKNIFKKTC